VIGNYNEDANISPDNTILKGSPISFIDNNGDGIYEYVNARSYWYSKVTVVGTTADVKITAIAGDGDSFDATRVLNGTNSADIYNGADLKVDDRVLVYKVDGKFGVQHVPVTNGTLTAAKDNSKIAVISAKEYKQPALASRVVDIANILTTSGNYNVEKDYRIWENWILEGPSTSAPGKKWALILDSFIQGTGIATNTKSVKLLLEDGTQGTYALGSIYKGTSTGSTYTLDAAPNSVLQYPDGSNSTPASNRIYVTGAAGDPLNTVILTPEAGAIALADVSADGKSVNLYDGKNAANGSGSYTSGIGNGTQDWDKDSARITFDNTPGDFSPTTKVGTVGSAATDTLINDAQVLDGSVMFAVRLWDSGTSDNNEQGSTPNGRFRSASVFKGRGMTSFMDAGDVTDQNIRYKVVQDISQTVGTGVVANNAIKPIVAASFVGARVRTLGSVIGNYAYVFDASVGYGANGFTGTIWMYNGTDKTEYAVAPTVRAKTGHTWNRGDIDSAEGDLLANEIFNVTGGDVVEYALNANGEISSIVTIAQYNGSDYTFTGLRTGVPADSIPGMNDDNGHAYVGHLANSESSLLKLYPVEGTNGDALSITAVSATATTDDSAWFGLNGSAKIYAIDTDNKSGRVITLSGIPNRSEDNADKIVAITAGTSDVNSGGGTVPNIVALFYIENALARPNELENAAMAAFDGPGGGGGTNAFAFEMDKDGFIRARGNPGGETYGLLGYLIGHVNSVPESLDDINMFDDPQIRLTFAPAAPVDQITTSTNLLLLGDKVTVFYRIAGTEEILYKHVTIVNSVVATPAAIADGLTAGNEIANPATEQGVTVSTPVITGTIGEPGASIAIDVALSNGTSEKSMPPEVDAEMNMGTTLDGLPIAGMGFNIGALLRAYGLELGTGSDSVYIKQTNPAFAAFTTEFTAPDINTTVGFKVKQYTLSTFDADELFAIPVMSGDDPITIEVYEDDLTVTGSGNSLVTSGGTLLFTVVINPDVNIVDVATTNLAAAIALYDDPSTSSANATAGDGTWTGTTTGIEVGDTYSPSDALPSGVTVTTAASNYTVTSSTGMLICTTATDEAVTLTFSIEVNGVTFTDTKIITVDVAP
jgi:hypothetical protein